MKRKQSRNPAYLAFVRTLPSIVSKRPADVAHHIRLGTGGGMGLKPSDYCTVPLTNDEHLKLHTQGEAAYWQERGIDPDVAILTTISAYGAACHLDLPSPHMPTSKDLRELWEKVLEDCR
jgi:hypothetical protein